MISPEKFQQRVLEWFDLYGRKDLPWQQNINPYRVWVSEIMLQQTQVTTVIPYFQRFMASFPDVRSLASSPLDDVLQHWAGLGYYARARNLHKSAQIITDNGGEFPATLESLVLLPGIGRSTAGAILSIACQQSQPILDGNVRRVLTRCHGIFGWPSESKTNKSLWDISSRYTPSQRAADYTQAMMDLGATVCIRRKPICDQCPLHLDCYAYREGKTDKLPETKPRKKIPVKKSYWLTLRNRERQILLNKRPPTGIWGGLWSLPEFASLTELQQWCAEQKIPVDQLQIGETRRHTFSHYHLDYIAVDVYCENPENCVMEANQVVWYKTYQIDSLGLPTPVKQLLRDSMIEEYYDENG